MTIRLTISILAAAFAAGLGAAQSQTPVAPPQAQAVPRAGFAFTNTVSVTVTIDSVDTDTRTVVFTLPDGNWLNLAAADSVRGLDAIKEGETHTVTYNEVVTILNLKRKGVGSQAARRDTMSPKGVDEEPVRFTYTVVSVDQVSKKISLIPPGGGAVRTVTATSPATLEAIKTMKTGDVLIGIATPLLITSIAK